MSQWLNTKEVSKLVGLSESRLCVLRLDKYNKNANGKRLGSFLPFYKIGSKVVYKKSDVNAFIKKAKIS